MEVQVAGRLREQARGLAVRIYSTVSDALSSINAADLVVSMAGYNTLSEILRFRKRAVIVPRPGPSAEQGMRASLFAQRGLISVIEQDGLSAHSLAGAVQDSLAKPAPPSSHPWPGVNGIATVTAALIAALPARPPAAGREDPAVPVVAVENPQAPVAQPVTE
jgi:predicted glycosyltransferase